MYRIGCCVARKEYSLPSPQILRFSKPAFITSRNFASNTQCWRGGNGAQKKTLIWRGYFNSSATSAFHRNFATEAKKVENTATQSTANTVQQTQQESSSDQEVSHSPSVMEVDADNFSEYVMKSPVPVLLDLYADWCEPCKVLTPKMEKAVLESKGGMRLAKLNVDENPELVQQMNVTQIPAVFVFYKGKVVHHFLGLLEDDKLKKVFESVLKISGLSNASQQLKEADTLLSNNDVQGAAQIYSALLNNPASKAEGLATAGLARCAVAEGNIELAKQLIDNVKANYPDDLAFPEVKKALAAVELASSAAISSEDQQALIEKVAKDPNDLQAKYDLAASYFATGKHNEALEECFAIIKKQKKWQDDAARKLALKIFEALGASNEIAIKGRRRLSNLLFV